jgi:signal transduction histidine kinase
VNSAESHDKLKLNLAVFWLVFTIIFAVWWFKLSLDHVSELGQLQPQDARHWSDQRHMILWEGIAWLVLLAVGGMALIVLVNKERGRVQSLVGFFASFSHEVKTSLASLRLQAESLKDDLKGVDSPVLDRLIGDTVRLQLQLENSLFFASQDSVQFYVQSLLLSQMIERIREQWTDVELCLSGDCRVRGDDRALRTVFSNLIQNAMIHGQSTRVLIEPRRSADGMINIRFQDNGKGFAGSPAELGRLFHRPTATSGSGLGLYIARFLLEKLGGGLELSNDSSGFRAEVIVPGVVE